MTDESFLIPSPGLGAHAIRRSRRVLRFREIGRPRSVEDVRPCRDGRRSRRPVGRESAAVWLGHDGAGLMALAAPVLEQAYRYPFESSVIADGSRARLRLATSGGPAANPEFFRGRLLEPVVASDLLLTIGDVARARFHVPPAMLARILLLADPVATCADERLRFEAFSACCSVYGRADFLPAGFDGEMVGRGTTNVDMGTRLRAALAGIQDRGNLGLSVGESVVEVTADGESAIERRVPLPSRWVRGFVEVQAIMADLEPAASADGSGARLFFRSIPKSPPKAPVWVGPVGSGLRLSHHDAGRGSIPVSGIGRLRLFERAARHATGLRLYALGG